MGYKAIPPEDAQFLETRKFYLNVVGYKVFVDNFHKIRDEGVLSERSGI